MANVLVDNCKPAKSYTSVDLQDPVKIRRQDGDAAPITVPQLFEKTVKQIGERPALMYRDHVKKWKAVTYQDYWDKSRQMARAFVKLGLEPRTSCGILAISCPEWFFAQMATIYVGGVSAGIYLTNSAEACCHVLQTSDATICVVDDSAQMEKVRSVRHRLPRLKAIVQIRGPFRDFVDTEEGFYSWSKVEAMGADDQDLERQVEERMRNVAANECISIIYTSGTVGMPKGVMLTHDSFIILSQTMVKNMVNVNYGHEVIVSYLPMNHVGGQILDFFIGLWLGACVYFADKNAMKGTLLHTMVEAQPTRFFGVPRIYEKMHEKVIASEQNLSWLPKLILTTARSIMEDYNLSQMEVERKTKTPWGYWLTSKIAQRIRVPLGLGRCKTFLIGAAPTNMETKYFLLGCDINLIEMYGLSESGGPSHANWEKEDLDSCGRAIPCTEVKLHNMDHKGNGEICLRGRTVFMGYLHAPELTREALTDDGWLHTGDIGFLDSKGRLRITGRLKEIIVTSGGENIPPVHIERLVLQALPGLSNAMVVGDRRKYLTMLVTIKTIIDPHTGKPSDTLQPESLEWIKSLGQTTSTYVTLTDILAAGPCPKVLQSIQEGIDRANANAISNAQRVQKFTILPHDFSIPTGELGPTLKLRRNIVLEKYADIIEGMYSGKK